MGEFTNAERLVEFDERGQLQAETEILQQLRSQRFKLTMSGDTVTLKLRPRHISEIKDPQERALALSKLLDEVAIGNGPGWPEDYDLRDEIYD